MHCPRLPGSLVLLFAIGLTTNNTSASLLGDENLPVVLTPARLKQNRTEVPASVSVIDRDMIIASGLREIPELFRLIPGTSVGARDGYNYVVSYHGSNYRDSRRMQVLIDGRSVYQAGLATVDWTDIPISIEDIQRIEVVRGPATASYGANAFLGVINIITRHPADSEKLIMSARRGTEDSEDYRISHAGEYANGFYKITVNSRKDNGFDSNKDGGERIDSKNVKLINSRYEKQLSESINGSFGFGYKKGWTNDDPSDIDTIIPRSDTVDYYFSGKLDWDFSPFHIQSLRVDFSSQDQETKLLVAIPPAGFNLSDNPNPLVFADADEDIAINRKDIDFQDSYIWSEKFQTIAGFHLKQSRVSSETYYDGTIDNHSYQLFFNGELKITEKITLNGGGSYEYEENNGKNFSPRITLHYHISPDHSFRAIYSEAIRTPDLLETSAKWQYTGRNIRPSTNNNTTAKFYFTAEGNPDLKPERIKSKEIGYYGNFRHYNLQWDVKLFDDKLDRLISKSIALFSFDPTNENELSQRGIETEVDFRPNHKWLFHFSYAYIDAQSDVYQELSFTPTSAGSTLLSYSFTPSLQLSISQYYARPIGTDLNKFSRSDIRLAKRFRLGHSRIEVAYTAQYRHDNDTELLANNIYDNKLRQWLSLSVQF